MENQEIPDAEESSGRLIAVILVLACLIIIAIFFFVEYTLSKENDAREAQRKADCTALAIKYGDTVTAKTGFYAGVKMEAIEAGEEHVLTTVIGEDSERTQRWLCAELEITEPDQPLTIDPSSEESGK